MAQKGYFNDTPRPKGGSQLSSPSITTDPCNFLIRLNTLSFIVEESDSIALLSGLDLEGICASSGSACSSGSVTPSHVVKATGASDSAANSLVRFSLGRESSREQVELVADLLPRVVAQARGMNK